MACKTCGGGVTYTINEQYFIDNAIQNATAYAKAHNISEMVIYSVAGKIAFAPKGSPQITGEIIEYLYIV